ncbi:Ig-like domain-containing protein, partial [Pseudomonas sp.]|uniref:Ig-like domain-containing protein n=1 Tax=Pseudomonas sp. TaxID=306 RepID=UPI00258854FF
LSSAQVNGELLTLVQTDAAGNHSLPLVYQAADTTAPDDVTALAVSATGLAVTGLGEANATVTVTSAAGATLGTATVGVDGHFTVVLNGAQLNGETLTVSQADPAGNLSGNQTVTASDITAPGIPTVTILSTDGLTLTGTAEANSQVTVTSADGTLLGTATATAGGTYSVGLNAAQINGQVLSIVATDASTNASTPLTYTAADTQAPDAVTNLSISADHSQLAGRGEVGATVEVTDAVGTSVGTGIVAANGTFVIDLTPGIVANAVLTVVQTDTSNNTSLSADLTVPVNPAPDAPTNVVLEADGVTLAGGAVANSTITVYSATGTVLGTGTTDADGAFTVTLSSPQTNGQTLSVTASTATGGASLPTEVVAADTTAPDPLSGLAVTGAGLLVTGHGEAGATVTVTSATGAVLGTGLVNAAGTFTVTLNAAQTNGQLLTAVQTDTHANTSTAVTVQAADTTAPVAPSLLALDTAGLVLSGLGETGATVTVTNAAGTVLGTGTVVGGTFAVTLSAAQLNGQTLTVSQADTAGNVSAGTALVANDTTAPAQLANLALTGTGLQVTGTGEAGATVTVTSATGTVLGTTQVGSAGTFTVTLGTAQLNGQVLTLVQTDAAGNTSLASTLTATDTQAPTAPTTLALAVDGTTLTGAGEAGATVTVSSAGVTLGTAVVGTGGTFTVTLSSAQLDGQVLTVRQADAAGNVSATASLTAPDTTAPAAPTGVLVNASGTVVTGTGVAGSTVKVTLGTTVLGTTT